jgi:hypothetical protein
VVLECMYICMCEIYPQEGIACYGNYFLPMFVNLCGLCLVPIFCCMVCRMHKVYLVDIPTCIR